MNLTTEQRGPAMNSTDAFRNNLGGGFQNFTFRDIVSSDLFLPDLDSPGDFDYGDSSLTHLGLEVGGHNGKDLDIVCNGSTVCNQLINSTVLGEVVESSTRKFTDSDLWEENDYFALLNIPAMVFIVVLMIFGIVGNVLVVYVYGFRFKPTTQHFLIVCLACLDLLMACIAMPTDIADLRFHHTFSSSVACKLLRFITMFSSTSSSFTLVTIAWDRHKRVIKPLTRQMTLKDAKTWEGLNLLAAVFFSWPLLVITGLRTSETRVHGLYGTDCSFSDTFHGTRWPLYYNSILGLGFIVMVMVLGTLYFQIWKKAKRHRIYMAKRMEKGPLSTTSAINEAEGRVTAKNQRILVIGKNQAGENYGNELKEFNKSTDQISPNPEHLKFSPNKETTNGCKNFASGDFRHDSIESLSGSHRQTDQFNFPLQPDRDFCNDLSDTNSPVFTEDVIDTTDRQSFPAVRIEESCSVEELSDIPVFPSGVKDRNHLFLRSDSITSEKSQTQTKKKAVVPTLSSSSSLRVWDESNCLISRSKSLASVEKDSLKPTSSSKPRRVSLPYILVSKPFRHPTKKIENTLSPQSLQENSNLSCQREGNCSSLLEQLEVEKDFFDQENNRFDRRHEGAGNIIMLKQDESLSKDIDDFDSTNQGSIKDLSTCISAPPSSLITTQSAAQYLTDTFNIAPEQECSNCEALDNDSLQVDIDDTNLNVFYQNKNSMCSLDSRPSVSFPSPARAVSVNQTLMPCQSPTPPIGGESRGRYLSINSISSTCIPTSSYTKQTGNPKRSSRTIDKTTIVAFAVSIVFVVSFLPYLSLMFVRAFVQDFDYKLQDGTLWLYSFFLRFYLLNSALNPLLYGWLNERFRAESKRLLCCGQRRKRFAE